MLSLICDSVLKWFAFTIILIILTIPNYKQESSLITVNLKIAMGGNVK